VCSTNLFVSSRIRHRRDRRRLTGHMGTGAAVGAGTGLVAGSAVGAGNARAAGVSLQARYDTFMHSAWPPKAIVLRDPLFIRRPTTKLVEHMSFCCREEIVKAKSPGMHDLSRPMTAHARRRRSPNGHGFNRRLLVSDCHIPECICRMARPIVFWA
jgi:hypothetical protein